VQNWIIPYLGRHRLDRLLAEHLDAFYARLPEEGLAANTILQIHRILSRALTLAVRRGKVARNVCTLIDAPSGVEAEIEPISGRTLAGSSRWWESAGTALAGPWLSHSAAAVRGAGTPVEVRRSGRRSPPGSLADQAAPVQARLR
jgi:hypothetical protein